MCSRVYQREEGYREMSEIDLLIEEAELDSSNKNLIDYITSNLFRVVNSKNYDQRKMLLLIAAIAMLNVKDETAANAARKIAQMNISKK
jgi:hypothetical protein